MELLLSDNIETKDDHDKNACSTGDLVAKADYIDGPYTIKVISRSSDQVIKLPEERLFETDYGHYCGLVYEQTLTPVLSSTDLLIDSSNQFFSVKANAATQDHTISVSATLSLVYTDYEWTEAGVSPTPPDIVVS